MEPGNNPFTTSDNFEIHCKETYINNYVGIVHPILVESTPPASIHITDDLLMLISKFSTSGKDMVFYITRYLGYNRETIRINPEQYCSRMGCSLRTFQRAKSELLNYFIEPKARHKDVYYINPKFIFKGSRVKCYADRVVVDKENATLKTLRELKLLPERSVKSVELADD